MQELQPTTYRVLSIWWLLIWRWIIGGFLIGTLVGFVVGFFLGLAGHPELSSASLFSSEW
jgi:hypothetical protein